MSQDVVSADTHFFLPPQAAVVASHSFRALIVEDDSDMRELTRRALERENIQCDTVCDAEVALQMLQQHTYDLLVTDLRLPRASGDSLAIEALAQSAPPVVVVVTGETDPRLARDLRARGVSDFIPKPFQYNQLGPRIRRLLPAAARRRLVGGPAHSKDATESIPKITLSQVQARVEKLERLMPISQAALDVVRMVQSTTGDSRKVAAAIELDPTLASEVLRLANSTYYNPAGQELVDVDEAVVRIGHRRLGELAVLASDMPIIDRKQIPWMNVALSWQRSMAAGIACERLAEALNLPEPEENAFLCSLLHGMGRTVLATLFPDEYQTAVALCQRTGISLAECETNFLPETPSAFLARLLKRWHLPAEIYEPLQYVDDSYESLSRLDDSLRSQVELIKVSALLGKVAIGQWETWDELEFPSALLCERLGLEEAAVRKILSHTRGDLASLSDLFALESCEDSYLQSLSGAWV